MSDSVVDLLQLQVQQLLIRVEILEKTVVELEQSGHHGSTEDFEFVTGVYPRHLALQGHRPARLPKIPWPLRFLLYLWTLFACGAIPLSEDPRPL